MSISRALVASDAHLGAVSPEQERRFLAFLETVPDRADELVLVGDVFDFWFEWRHAVQGEHFAALRRLADLVDAGLRVRMVGGNHDAWGGPFLEGEVGVELVEGPVVTEVGGRRTFLAHGDGLADGDWGYRILKQVIRSRTARVLFRLLHPDLAIPLVRRVSGTDRESTAEEEAAAVRTRAEVLSAHADEVLRRRPEVELVLLGHAHRPELREVEPGRHYLNPGDWIRSFTYGVVGPGGVDLRRWEGD